MDALISIDWEALFIPSTSLLEVALRGTLIYLALVVLMRFMRRDAGSMSMADLLLIVLIADAAQNGMAGEYRSVTEGVALVGTIALWDRAIDTLAFRWPRFARLLEPPPLPLVRNGQLLYANLRREHISEQELMSQLRQHGVDKLATVKRAYLEPDGQISVLRVDGEKPPRPGGPPVA